MPVLILTFKKQIIRKFPFVTDTITIGRRPENEITIDNLAVSGHHARIDKTGSDFILTDLQSTNGTFVNSKKVVTHTLKHGDNVTIGKHVILFLESEKERAETPKVPSNDEKTIILDASKKQELQAKRGAAPQAEAKGEKIGVLSSLDDSGLGEIELIKKLTRMGKSENCEIRLGGMFMGSTAATISKRPVGYSITFAGGMAKLRINGKVVTESVLLKEFDTIELGSHKFEFYEKERK